MTTNTLNLFLSINNPHLLEHGSLPSFSPGKNGATIGSGRADWRLYDAMGSVDEIHAAIQMIDGKHSLVDLCGKTYINHYRSPLGKFYVVALNDADLIRIGKYEINVHFDDRPPISHYGVRHVRELEVDTLLNYQERDDLLSSCLEHELLDTRCETDAEHEFRLLAEPTSSNEELDPVHALHQANLQRRENPKHRDIEAIVSMHVSDRSATTIHASRHEVPQQYNGRKNVMDSQSTNEHYPQNDNVKKRKLDHIVSGPLINSLGLPAEEMTTEEAHHLLTEAGSALKAAVSGLLEIYQAEKSKAMDLALMGRSYQPIEDNPLRMGLSYEDTISALFSPHRSRVHLSPTHAIQESIANIRCGQDAIMDAIRSALWQVLQAFSPEQLERRFEHYRSQHDIETKDSDWVWEMYQSYFDELVSNRQAGLEKMFWEVFEQDYDRAMRQEQQEGAK